jgi:hypothetical protein
VSRESSKKEATVRDDENQFTSEEKLHRVKRSSICVNESKSRIDPDEIDKGQVTLPDGCQKGIALP